MNESHNTFTLATRTLYKQPCLCTRLIRSISALIRYLSKNSLWHHIWSGEYSSLRLQCRAAINRTVAVQWSLNSNSGRSPQRKGQRYRKKVHHGRSTWACNAPLLNLWPTFWDRRAPDNCRRWTCGCMRRGGRSSSYGSYGQTFRTIPNMFRATRVCVADLITFLRLNGTICNRSRSHKKWQKCLRK